MPLLPFGLEGDLPEGLHQVSIAEFFAYFGSNTPQRVRLDTRLQFDRGRLPVLVDTLFDPVLAKRLYRINMLSIPEGSAVLPTLLDGLAITRAFTRRGLVEVRL